MADKSDWTPQVGDWVIYEGNIGVIGGEFEPYGIRKFSIYFGQYASTVRTDTDKLSLCPFDKIPDCALKRLCDMQKDTIRAFEGNLRRQVKGARERLRREAE